MGIMNHNVIIATTFSAEKAAGFWAWVEANLSDREQELIAEAGSWVNGYQTFMVAPDGSKEGWAASDEGDALRERIIARLKEDSGYWEWVEVGFGEYGQKVLRGNCVNC